MAGRSGQMSYFPGFQPLVYIVCVLPSRLLSWVRMFSGLGILVAPRSSNFRITLDGYFSFHFFIPREEVLINNALNSCGFVNCLRVLTTILFLQDGESTATGTPDAGRGFGSSCPGNGSNHGAATEPGWPEG